ncbi:MAG: Polysaccharide deacetylase [Syntrophus sp. PtaB.Bin138]|nr:MAG: Polysaccharide deacetylase [Syntrophus sp. PtaB.Bin138]
MIFLTNEQRFVLRIFSKIPLFRLVKLMRRQILVPYYHMITNEAPLHTKHLYGHKNIRQFTEDLDFLLKNFLPVNLMDVMAFLKADEVLPDRALLLTFDDGFREMYDVVAPILLNKGISSIFFVNSAFTDNRELCFQHKASILVEHIQAKPKSLLQHIGDKLRTDNHTPEDIKKSLLSIEYRERAIIDEVAALMEVDFSDYLSKNKPYLTSEQILILIRNGFHIGAHSIDHPLYASLSMEEQLRQTRESVGFVKERYHLNYGVFAFPHSDRGVSRAVFEEIYGSGLVDIFFGTGGITGDFFKNNIQRFSLEKPPIPAKDIITYEYARKIYRKMKGNDRIMRDR